MKKLSKKQVENILKVTPILKKTRKPLTAELLTLKSGEGIEILKSEYNYKSKPINIAYANNCFLAYNSTKYYFIKK